MPRERARRGRVAGNRRGATLVEAIVAVGLFGVVAGSIGNLFVRQTRLQGANTTATTAIALAEAELEDLRALAYDQVASQSARHDVGGIRYEVETQVDPDTPDVGMKTVRTTVMWTEPEGVKSYDLHAIYTNVAH